MEIKLLAEKTSLLERYRILGKLDALNTYSLVLSLKGSIQYNKRLLIN